MGLRDIGARLPPGFRFYPSDEELVCHYLHNKIILNNNDNEEEEESLNNKSSLIDIDLHTCEPWQLPQVAKLNNTEWYFFSFRDRKYATGYRTNRATTSGYWKATGKDRVILHPKTKDVVGMRKTLVFYRNRAPNGIKSGWIMHEFRLESPHMPPKEDWVLCRVFHKGKEENNNNQFEYIFDDNRIINSSSSPSSSNTNYHPNHSINCPYQNKPMIINPNYDGPTILNNPNPFLQTPLKDDNGLFCNMDLEGNSKFGEGINTILQHGVFEDICFGNDTTSPFFI